MHPLDDTIAAIATAPGGALRGVVRLSGPNSLTFAATHFKSDGVVTPIELNRAQVVVGRLSIKPFTSPLPCQLYVWPNNRSYTRQPVVEIHTIGSPPILDAVLAAVCQAGVRLASPGEFTMRSFLAGRIDLMQAEAVLGVIDARSTRQLSGALRQLAGGLSEPLSQLREELLDLLSHLEAGLDFAEEDIEFVSPEKLIAQLGSAGDLIASIIAQITSRGEQTTNFRVALIGWPNVGKSSLLNALAGEAKAIVSHIAGTTRDYLTATLNLPQLQIELIDTAGFESLGENTKGLNSAGIAAKARRMADRCEQQARVLLLCLDATRGLNAWEREQLGRPGQIVVLTKTDLVTEAGLWEADRKDLTGAIPTSSQSGQGIERLRKLVAKTVSAATDSESSVVAATATRCRESLRQAAASLDQAHQAAANQWGEELVASEVRLALGELGKIVGAVYTDDILDRIFSRFCIGK